MSKIDSDDWAVVACIICIIMTGYISYNIAEYNLVQELCSKNQYDFCEVQETIYKLKEFKELKQND